jgi:hypothetical protein
MHFLVVACSKDWRSRPTTLGPTIDKVRNHIRKSPFGPFDIALRKHSAADNLLAWEQIKTYLNRCANHIFRTQPAVWLGRYGIHTGDLDYAELIFFDTIRGGTLAEKHGLGRCLALAGLYAYSRANNKDAVRALFLIAHHSEARRLWNASKPRATRKGKPNKQEIVDVYRQLADKKVPPRERASEAEKYFSRHGKSISARRLRDTMKGGNGS